MNNFFSGIVTDITTYISLPYLISFITLAYFLKPYGIALYEGFLRGDSKRKADPHWVVAIIGLIIAIPFMVVPSWETSGLKLFVTYAIGTSLHDLIIARIVVFFGDNSSL